MSSRLLKKMGSGLFAGLMYLMCIGVGWAADAPQPAGAEATYVGEKVCKQCHTKENANFGHTLHAKNFRLNPRNELEGKVCEACHGPGSRHVENASDRKGIIGFTREWGTPIDKQNGQCLQCHKGGQRIHWHSSTHNAQQVACSDCHNPMAKISSSGLLSKQSVTEVCTKCHQQQKADFHKRSHMPLPEGKMSCVDCHNPHGSSTQSMLKGDSVNALCYTCHAEKRGPFLWEHAPVRENCMNCHKPHGSNHDKLLVTARPFLCQQCHMAPHHASQLHVSSQLPKGNVEWINERVQAQSCQNCHSQVHGSNSPSGPRMHR
jgi:DmsE family decaheme c-type cytochrome